MAVGFPLKPVYLYLTGENVDDDALGSHGSKGRIENQKLEDQDKEDQTWKWPTGSPGFQLQ